MNAETLCEHSETNNIQTDPRPSGNSRWSRPNGYRDVLTISMPLVLSMMSNTVMAFTDRLFLGWYSITAISAAMPAFMAVFVFQSFFMGVGEYLNVFVAQYTGSGQSRKVGAIIWQGIYFALAAWVMMACLYFAAPFIFSLAGHPAAVREQEMIYFRILSMGSGFVLLAVSLSGFYSGRGLTRVLMFVHMTGALVNIPLDYVLINGLRMGDTVLVPEMGIAGAAYATVFGGMLIAVILSILVFRKKNEQCFALRSDWRLRPRLFGRFFKFGLPSGLQFCLDILAVACFAFMVGRLGEYELAATNIVFSLHTVIFLPMVGMHVGVSVLTGQAIGRERPQEARLVARSALELTLLYVVVIGIFFMIFPDHLVLLFKTKDWTVDQFAPILSMGIVLLRFLVFFTLFDALTMIYAGVLKGAGDIFYVMRVIGVCAICVLALPSWIGVSFLGFGVYAAWTVLTVYACSLGLWFYWRFRQGGWMDKSVIREAPEQTAG